MRVLFLCVPGRGRLEVLSPLAEAVARAGHDLRFAVPSTFAPLVRSAGFAVLEAGLDVPQLQQQIGAALPADAAAVADRAVAMFAGAYPEAMLQGLLPQLAAWPPDLVVHEEGEFSAPLVAVLAQVPCVTVGWPVAMKPVAVIERVTQPLRALWQAHGRDMPHWGGLYEQFIDTCPPALQSPDPELAALPRLARMQPLTASADPRFADSDLGIDASGRPVVHVTLGTVDSYNNAPDLVEAVLAGLAAEPVQVLLTTGQALAGLDVSRYPNVTARTFVPHRLLLPRCAAVVCHGGAGSTIAALAHGLPLLIIPRGGASQYRSGVHCARAGAGIHLPEAQATPAAVGDAVRSLLAEPTWRVAAQALRDEILAMPTPDACVDSLALLASPC
jgi:UDP:flavonoid glycosyltransferase YjiC (YdhE family)